MSYRTMKEEHEMTEQKTTGLNFEALRRGIEQRDADLLASLYADDAELRIVDRDNPPSSPRELRGKEDISEYLHDVFCRDMEHHVENEVVNEDRIAFNVACGYPDGTRVFAAEIYDVSDDGIVRQVKVQAWDE